MTYPRAILFDLDGTLIHSAPDLHAAANVMLGAMGRDTLDLATIISFIGNGVEALVERCLTATGDYDSRRDQPALGMFLDAYAADMTTLTRPYPGVVAALEDFRTAGVSLGICTNKPAEPAREICNLLGLSRYFEVIDGAMPGHPKKPDPQPLLRCCDLLGVSPLDVLYVGDSAIDYQTARNAGIRFRLYSEGYLNDALPELPGVDRFSNWAAHGIAIS
ncbi:MAG: phosphoglycolate phosphatase [Tateyamaria sp.]|uniref:phosphoglycolate phosphatase n=1 Tax=Tateyamaria sp. TaxID=1929288 RepID=UPI00329F061C